MADSTVLVMMDRERVHRVLKRMAYQVAENNRSDLDVCLVGIEHHGFITATLLGSYLSEIYGQNIQVLNLSLEESDPRKLFKDTALKNTYPLVVDDVIFSGKTMFAALNLMYKQFRLKEIHTGVLVDRGHRKFPIQAEFTGLELSTKLKEHVSVIVKNDTITKVVLRMH